MGHDSWYAQSFTGHYQLASNQLPERFVHRCHGGLFRSGYPCGTGLSGNWIAEIVTATIFDYSCAQFRLTDHVAEVYYFSWRNVEVSLGLRRSGTQVALKIKGSDQATNLPGDGQHQRA